MISSGAPLSACRNAVALGFSTARITRKRWSCGCIPSCWTAKSCPALVTKDLWRERFEDINALERYLTRNGVIVRKFFLHFSKQEQQRRLLKRLEQPEKHWKFSLDDLRERQKWGDYMQAYENMIRHTATDYAPWHVVPADHKWFTRLVVSEVVVHALESLQLNYPKVSPAKRKELAAARTALAINKA